MVVLVDLEFGEISMSNTEKGLTINSLDAESAYKAFYQTCACNEFCKLMVETRPYINKEELFNKAKDIFKSLNKDQWLESFEGHPKIGDVNSLKEKFKNTKATASNEQSGINSASDVILNDLTLYNEKYFNKFGYIFIICATGKTALEMLTLLRKRIEHNEEEEIYIASLEQLEITLIRMEKLV
jgi:2-oxo-4-hydroxy-4-carboxy-5-ureidoimidazoline decarboxylase